MGYYILTGLGVLALLALPAILFVFFTADLLNEVIAKPSIINIRVLFSMYPLSTITFILYVFILFIYFSIRFAFLLPGIAADQPMNIIVAWKETKGLIGKIFLFWLFLSLFSILLLFVYRAFPAIILLHFFPNAHTFITPFASNFLQIPYIIGICFFYQHKHASKS